jgi:hypothetical protein
LHVDEKRPDSPMTADSGEAAAAGRARRRLACLLAILLAVTQTGCSTPQMDHPPTVEALERIPIGTRVTIRTRDGASLRLKVTDTRPDGLSGRDRFFGVHELRREDIAAIEAPPQNDGWVALFFFAIVFVART